MVPGDVRASLDVRHACDEIRAAAVRNMCDDAALIASRRSLGFSCEEQMNQNAVRMDARLTKLIEQAMSDIGEAPRRMVSGAGHDAMIMAEVVPSAMLFVRSIGGISHHPDESVRAEDVEKAIRVGVQLVSSLATDMLGEK